MGFLIDAVATWFGFLCVSARERGRIERCCTQIDYLAEFNNHTDLTDISASPVLLLVVWTLKREVRASGECLGMYRR